MYELNRFPRVNTRLSDKLSSWRVLFTRTTSGGNSPVTRLSAKSISVINPFELQAKCCHMHSLASVNQPFSLVQGSIMPGPRVAFVKAVMTRLVAK